MSSVIVNGVELAFDDEGTGTDVVLLVHGHPFNRTMWRAQADAIRRAGWRLIAPDLRGYGETTVTPGRVTLDVFVADIAALLDRLAIRRVVIGGLSMGGQIVMEFCVRHADRVRGVLLAATFAHADSPLARAQRLAMAERVEREGMGGVADELLPNMLASRSRTMLPDVVTQVRDMMRSTNPAGAAAALRGRADRRGYEEVLAELKAPAVLVFGNEDSYASRADADALRALLTDSSLVWLDEVGHMPNLEAADDFNRALVSLLGKAKR
jgi:pimeloyl-ACP methyl ester carboxylesterase